MNLAAILGFFLLSLGSSSSPVLGFLDDAAELIAVTASNSNAAQAQGSASSSNTSSSNISSSQPQAAPAQNPSSAKTLAVPSSAKPNPTSAKPHAHVKKAIYPDCSNAPTTLNPILNAKQVAKPDSAAQAGNGSSDAGLNRVGSIGSGSAGQNSDKNSIQPGAAPSKPSKPCPPPKKIVRNGGADEPKIELLGGSPAQDASSERSIEQITTATEENLKKISERQLSSSQRETVSQIKQFIEQSKQAVAAGDPERANNLATKAHLLSEELVNP